MMEGPANNVENFESFKNRIAEIFKAEGLSEKLQLEIDKWHDERYEETDRKGDTIEQRVRFLMEFAKLYITIDRPDLAFDTLDDAWTQAEQEGLSDLVDEIKKLMNSLNG